MDEILYEPPEASDSEKPNAKPPPITDHPLFNAYLFEIVATIVAILSWLRRYSRSLECYVC